MQLRLNITVWGAYVETLLDVLVPSLLTPGNLGALAAQHAVVAVDICTLSDDVARIQAHPLTRRLAETAPLLFHTLDTQQAHSIHHLLSLGHAITLDAARAAGQGCLIVPPDMVFSDRALGALGALIKDDTHAVLAASVRAECCGALGALARFYRADGVLAVPSHALIRTLLYHPHPVTASLRIGGDLSSIWPSHLYWLVGDEGLLVRGFHLHPLYVRPGDATIQDTIDGTYVDQLSPDGQGVVYVEDSSQIALLELSSMGHMATTIRHGAIAPAQVAQWARSTTTPLQRRHATRSIHLYGKAPTPALWAAAERDAAAFLEGIGL